MSRLAAPIASPDEHPEWSARPCTELEHPRPPFAKIDPCPRFVGQIVNVATEKGDSR